MSCLRAQRWHLLFVGFKHATFQILGEIFNHYATPFQSGLKLLHSDRNQQRKILNVLKNLLVRISSASIKL